MSKRREIHRVSITAFVVVTLLVGTASAQQVFVYPKKGQSAERNAYDRAFAACMESRDYTVR